MNHTGIFDDLNYMSTEEHEEELTRWDKLLNDGCAEFHKWNVYNPIENAYDYRFGLEFMDYITRGMKSFLKSPF